MTIKVESRNIAIVNPLQGKRHVVAATAAHNSPTGTSAVSAYGGVPAPSSGLDRLQPNFKLKTRLVNKEKLLEKGASQSVNKQVEQGRRLAEIQEATEQA